MTAHHVVIGLAATALLLGAAQPSWSMFCSKPSEPYCASSFGEFDNEDEFQQCRREVEDYVDDVKDYIDCLKRDIDDARSEANEAVEAFNRRARGGY